MERETAPEAPLTRWLSRAQNVASTVGTAVLPKLPGPAKRALTGGREVVIDGNTLDVTLRLALLGLQAAGVGSLVTRDDPAASRARMREMLIDLPGPQVHVDIEELALPGPAGDIPARLYRAPGGQPAPLLVFYHGGGWALGDLDTHDGLCRLTCRDGAVTVLAVDYRLAPEHPAPAAVDDALAAFEWACGHAAELGVIPGRVAVGGDSAGGNLAAVVSLLARDRARESGGPTPILQWLLYPRTDFTANTVSLNLFARGFLLTRRDIDWFHAKYLRGSGIDAADPRISPIYAESLDGLPPALVAVAGFDPLRDEGQTYAAALRAAGNQVDFRCLGSLIHGFASLAPLGGAGAMATAELISALRAHLSRV